MTSYDAYTSRNSKILTVASLQGLRVENLIPAPAECEVQSVIKFLKIKWRRALSAGVVLLHDNARPHTARRLTHLLQDFSWEVFNHPPHNLDVAPSEFHLFLHLKKFISGQRFQNNREIEMSVIQRLQSQEADFYDTGIQKLIPRYDKMPQFRRWICWKIALFQ